MLKINNLTKYYGNILGIKDLSLEIKKGEIYGFIGPNGSGKSTTIRSIMKLINIDKGDIIINNNINFDKNLIGYLPSEVKLYESDKVINLFKYNNTFYKQDTMKRALELSKKLNLDVNKKIEELSYGNLKKVGIVLALAHEPKFIILDEPTSGLDPLIQNTFFELLKEEKKKGNTILFSSHILSEIKNICDKVAILKDNQLLKVEDISDLNTSYYNIYLESDNLDKISKELEVKIINNRFIYDREINDLLKIINKHNVKKILIEEPSIEEIFLEFYKGEL